MLIALRLGCENSGGANILSEWACQKPGVFEVPLGTPFSTLLSLAGGMRSKAPLKAIIPGGSSMRVLPAKATKSLTMDYDALVNAGSSLGTGGIIVMDKNTCMVETLACISRFYKHESCGQCTPCREDGWVVRLLIEFYQVMRASLILVCCTISHTVLKANYLCIR